MLHIVHTIIIFHYHQLFDIKSLMRSWGCKPQVEMSGLDELCQKEAIKQMYSKRCSADICNMSTLNVTQPGKVLSRFISTSK